MRQSSVFNFRILLASNSVLSFAIGIFSPFYIIFLQDFGKSIEFFGFAMGLMVLAESITSYFIGRCSDKFGRKIFLITAGYILALVIIAYTFITNLIQLYVLQIIMGINQAIQMTMETTLLGDFTEKVTRGTNIGTYHAVSGILAALAMMGGGLLAGQLGITIIFYIAALLVVVSTTILLSLREHLTASQER